MGDLFTSSPHDIKIVSVLVTSDRFEEEYELVRNVTEINIYEHLDKPYLLGSIMIADSSNLLNRIGFLGTEKITISLKINGDERSLVKTKVFVVTDVGGVSPVNDVSEAISLNIIEEHAYASRLVTMSKAYNGKPENIISQIMFDGTSRRVDVPDDFSESASPEMKVIVPSITPIQAATWVRNRMITEIGSPFFLYATFNGPNLFLKDLDRMLLDKPINEDRPYVFGQAYVNQSVFKPIPEQARVIETYKLANSENMFKMAAEGVLNSNHQFIDTLNTESTADQSIVVAMKDVIEQLKNRGILSRDQVQPIYDDKFTINGKRIDEYNTAPIKQIVTSNTFTDYANYYETENIDQQKLRAYSYALRHYLLKSPLEITMPGFDFMGRGDDITIGKQVSLQFLKNDPAILDDDGQDALDPKRTGNYVIYSLRHIIRPERYTVSMSCVKLGEKNE